MKRIASCDHFRLRIETYYFFYDLWLSLCVNLETSHGYNLTTLQLDNLTILQPYNFTALQSYNFTTLQRHLAIWPCGHLAI